MRRTLHGGVDLGLPALPPISSPSTCNLPTQISPTSRQSACLSSLHQMTLADGRHERIARSYSQDPGTLIMLDWSERTFRQG